MATGECVRDAGGNVLVNSTDRSRVGKYRKQRHALHIDPQRTKLGNRRIEVVAEVHVGVAHLRLVHALLAPLAERVE